MEHSLGDLGARRLLSEILARYGSVDDFCAHLHRLLDYPTIELPSCRPNSTPSPGGRHHRHDGR
ncbi:hypothetical protein [Nocardia sp. XZ_19_385]|uniref:hypothetical protein n=1 Tax=Nocardia sp. XZ_19_385 TaxID=2769488 RepID=UPI00188E244A|nr:hypothetical protein [Nocardia sp. XZ_19_385]